MLCGIRLSVVVVEVMAPQEKAFIAAEKWIYLKIGLKS
jgi:hypothetical protein